MPNPLDTLRADVIGSLAPPPALSETLERFDRGAASAADLRAAEDQAIRNAIARQQAAGLPVVSDGELRRRNFQESFANAVSGFDVPQEHATDYQQARITTAPLQRAEQDFNAPGPAIHTRRPVVERLRLIRNVPLEEYAFASGVAAAPVKVTLLSPDRISQRFAWERSQQVYAGMDAFLADVVAIEREMIAGLVAAGCRYIQIDAPGYTAYVDPPSLERMRARGENPDANLERSIQADNAVIAGFDGVTFGLHVCRGNPRGRDPQTGKIMPQWHREGFYDGIAERLFNGLHHQRLLLEYDSERAGDFSPLRHVPAGKIAVLGLVTTKSADLEPVDALKRRIDEAARYLPVSQLALSPQCGFGGLSTLTLEEDEVWRKLVRVVETARTVWGSVA